MSFSYAVSLPDFTVLAEDPLEINPIDIKDIRIEATVFEGKVFDIKSS